MRVLVTAVAATVAVLGSGARAAVPPARKSSSAPALNIQTAAASKTGAKGTPNFEAVMGAIDKMFPAQPEPDPARLALARTTVRAMWPDGAYANMMSGFMGNIFDGVMQMKKSDLAPLAKKADKSAKATDNLSIHDQAAAKDPYFDQRMAAIRGLIDEEVGKMSTVIDPRMRDGLARAIARRFDGRQLADINAFFATPSGNALATQYMQLWTDPDTMRSMIGAFPEMMKLMPDAAQKLKAIDAKFPKPKATTPSKATKN